MRCGVLYFCGATAFWLIAAGPISAQQEVVRPGETYNSLQAGNDAYFEAEAERRAVIGRQLMLIEQIQAQNTWSDPQDKYRPVRPESYGPVRPSVYGGPTLADVYAHPRSEVVLYNAPAGAAVARAYGGSYGAYAAPVPAFEPWPRVPGDIWGTPYYNYGRQPIGHVKIWTGRLSYIYKPLYASPPTEPSEIVQPTERVISPRESKVSGRSVPRAETPGMQAVPPPPAPAPPPAKGAAAPGNADARMGQEL